MHLETLASEFLHNLEDGQIRLPVEPGIGGMGDPDQEQRISELGQLLGP